MTLTGRFLFLLAAVGAACSRPAAPLRIGVATGYHGIEGARLAAEDVAAAGGVGGRAVELVIVPSAQATVADASIRIADSLASDPSVVAVVGHSNSAASLAASQIYNARRLPQVAPTSTAPLYSGAGPYSFRLVPHDLRQAEFLARQVRASAARRIAVVYVNDDYGRALHAAVLARLDSAAVDVVYDAPVLEAGDSATLRSVAAGVAAVRPALLLWLARPDDLRVLLGTLRALAPSLPILGGDALDTAPVIRSPATFAGVRFVRLVDPSAGGERMRRFRERLRASTGTDASAEAVLSYDAVMLIVDAMRAGATTRERLRAHLAGIGTARPAWTGLAGPVAFDSLGDVTRAHLLAEARADGVHRVQAR